ncbi:hypothetical protein [Flavobacterium sp. FlaQc-48]|uniref:hypothetical protein n=1 Tax=Flavobacterium sp. FlaQc-48 TaxID=3374181 RepID=UPI00375802D5
MKLNFQSRWCFMPVWAFFVIFFPILFFAIVLWVNGRVDRQKDTLRKSGVKTAAEILNIRMAPFLRAGPDFPTVVLNVTFKLENGKIIEAEVEEDIAVTHLSKFQPKQIIDIRYDPKKIKEGLHNVSSPVIVIDSPTQ